MSRSRWLAIACSAAVTTLWSISAFATVDVPVDLIVTNVSGTSVSFSWTGTTPAFRAVIKAGSLPASPNDGTLVFDGLSAASPPNTATATGLSVNTRYFIAVYGEDNGATYSSSAVSTSIITTSTRQVLTDGGAPPWDRRGSPTRNGKFIYTTNGGDLDLFNGTTVQPIQPKGAFGNDPNTVFTLGTAAVPAQFIAGWRRGTDDAYLSIDGAPPVVISATNPVNPGIAMNCELITIDQGYVFAVFRAPVGATEVRNAFAINPTTGVATNISNNTTTYGVIHMSSSGNKAAWAFDDGTGALKLQYYNGVTATTIDSNILGDPSIAQGRIVYAKYVSLTRAEIFHYDTNLPSPAPVQLTNDATKTNDSPFTDGRHAAWVRRLAVGTGPEVVLNGQVQLTSGNFALLDNTADPPFQLDRGQIAWRDNTGAIHHVTPSSDTIVDPAGSASRAIPWLADGKLVFYDQTVPPVAIYLYEGEAPNDDLRAPMTLKATPSGTSITLTWDAILGATSYNVYYAAQPGVSRDEYVFLNGGTRLAGITSNSKTINSLAANTPYYFVVTAVDASGEGAESREVSTVLIGTRSWAAVGGLTGTEVATVAADRYVSNVAYAAAGNFPGPYTTYKSTDSGTTWTPLAGGIETQNVRAIAADNGRVFATTRYGPILRSMDGGTAWTIVAPTAGNGQLTETIAIDPAVPNTIVAADFTLPTFTGTGTDANVIRSDNNGLTWFHTPQTMTLGGSLAAYALAFDPTHTSTLFLGGNGTPNVAKSIAGGAGWADAQPSGGAVYTVAVDPRNPSIVYAGIQQPAGTRGVWKSLNGGAAWTRTSLTIGVWALVIDPADSNVLHAGTDGGYYYSINGGTTWTLNNTGLSDLNVHSLAMVGNHRLIAGTYSGLYLLDLAALLTGTLPAPTHVVATGTAPGSITIKWDEVPGATGYDVYYRSDATGYSFVAGVPAPQPSTLAFGLPPDRAFLFRVVAKNATARSDGSAAELALSMVFADDPLSSGSTLIKYVHLDKLRTATNAMRFLAGLPTHTFTTGGAVNTAVTAAQMNEIRTWLDPALVALHLPSGGYTDTITSGVRVKAVHQQEIRDRLK